MLKPNSSENQDIQDIQDIHEIKIEIGKLIYSIRVKSNETAKYLARENGI